MAKFRIATPAGASFTVAGGDYGYEMEALTPIDAEIFEIPPGSEDEFGALADARRPVARSCDRAYSAPPPRTRWMVSRYQWALSFGMRCWVG